MVLWDRWMPLDTRWNSRSPDAVIAHFAGPRKPWQADYFMNDWLIEYAEVARGRHHVTRVAWPLFESASGRLQHRGVHRFCAARWWVTTCRRINQDG